METATSIIEQINSHRDWSECRKYFEEYFGDAEIYLVEGQYYADHRTKGIDLPWCGFAGPYKSLDEIKKAISAWESEADDQQA